MGGKVKPTEADIQWMVDRTRVLVARGWTLDAAVERAAEEGELRARRRRGPHKCFICGAEQTPIDLNWQLDAPNGPRCPRHRTTEKRMATLGDIVTAKRSRT